MEDRNKKINVIVQKADKDKAVMQACISFTDLIEIAKFTARIDPALDPYDIDSTKKEYQRKLNIPHLNEIADYIKKAIRQRSSNHIALFPTSLLIAFDDFEFKHNINNSIEEITLPEYCYIVDGQHRLQAMKKVYESTTNEIDIQNYLNDFKFNCTILLNFDIWEQAQIFADVNFKQKKVNKSLYYDIYGSYPPEDKDDYKRNAIFLAHALVKYLNSNEDSPFYHSVKMLGDGEGFISQAFLVESLLLHIQHPRGIWYIDSNICTEDTYRECIKKEVVTFFNIIKTEFTDIWRKENYIIHKTTGIGALMRIMGHLHSKIQGHDSFNIEFIEKEYEKRIIPYISKIKEQRQSLFDKNTYGSTGGKGLESRLYNEMKDIVDKLD